MRRILSYVLVFMLGVFTLNARQLDSVSRAELSSRLAEYFDALKTESLEVQKSEADFMIEASSDTLIRQFVASRIYDMYAASPVMGAEGVAVHVFDKWFKDGPLNMESDMAFLSARIFAEFNRQSLIGNRAPELVLETMDGGMATLFSDNQGKGRYRIVFFYDAGCAKCKVESILLGNILETEDFPVDLYAVYVGDDRAAWESYVSERLDIEPAKAEVAHFWDPSMDSDFQRKYGVLQTPQMLLVDPDGIIAGRRLDAKALSEMLHAIFDEKKLEYGSDESARLFDGIFIGEGNVPSAEEVRNIADYIESSTLGRKDTVMFRQLTGDLLYYLSTQRLEGLKEGSSYLIDEKILSRGDIWKSEDDSLKIKGMARFMDDLLSRARPGKRIADLKVPGEMIRSSSVRSGEFRLAKLGGRRNFIIFHTEGCSVCDAEKAAALRLAASDRKMRVLQVNVDRIVADDPALANRLFDSFDLSSLPFIVETDRKGVVLRRYISMADNTL